MGTRRLTIYMFKESLEDFDSALAVDKTSERIELAPDSGLDGRLHVVRPPARTPAWVSFVQPVLASSLAEVTSKTVSGLLLLRVRERIFALTFGYGRALLNLSMIEFQFGLRVALNRIDPAQLRSLDTKTFEDLVVSTTTQVSKNAELPTFGVDVSTDILRGVTGEPRDVSFARRLSGSDALILNIDTTALSLSELCGDLLDAYEEDTYRENFDWIDQLALVREPDLIESLDNLVVMELRSGHAVSSHLTMPETILWEDVDAFRIAGTRAHVYEDLDLDEYLAELGAARLELSIKDLKQRRVSVRFARTEAFDGRWVLYRCLVSEQRVEGRLYVLIEGRWFAVSESLVDQVDSVLGTLSNSQLLFPASFPGEMEKEYNKRFAESACDSLLNLDARVKRPGGAASGIELCDVLTKDREFVHVKRKSRSATLSHLFAQGFVSGTTFLHDGLFRDQIRQEIESRVSARPEEWLAIIPDSASAIDRSLPYRVTFAVIANSAKGGLDWLPFFSKLNLAQSSRQLRAIGFDVAVVRIPVSVIGDAEQQDVDHGG